MFYIKNKFNNKIILQHQKLELIWTFVPIILIIIIRILSINLLFIRKEIKNNIINIKIKGT